MALVLVAVMMMVMSSVAFAADNVTITVNRDSTYAGDSGTRDYTWYRVFTATYTSVSSTAEGPANADGTPLDISVTPENPAVAYTATKTVAEKLGTIAADGTWTTNDGNKWFDLTKIAGTENFSVSWRSTAGKAATDVQEAAAWLIANNAYEASADMTAGENKWTAEVVPGYYLIKGSEGQNLVAATTDITINEKNGYPTLLKEEKDEDATGYDTTKLDVAVGDTIDYKLTVHVTGDANQDIVVTDTLSAGLKLDNTATIDVKVGSTALTADVAADPSTETEASTKDYAISSRTESGFVVTIHPNDNTKNKDVLITFTVTVTDAALTDTQRKNTAELKYNNDHYVITKTVEYTTYFTGIEKVDKDNPATKLEGVTFALKEGDNYFPVKKVDAGYYIFDDSKTNPTQEDATVETDANGLIKIRGLDEDKTYTLTELTTLDGYNLLDAPKTLTLTEDTGSAFANATADSFDDVENGKGTLLPSTGGIGTTIFYLLGAVLVLGAGILLVTKRRMSAE